MSKKPTKEARAEGDKVARLIKTNGSQYYIADVNLNLLDDMLSAVGVINQKLGDAKVGYMIISVSAGDKNLFVVTYVNPELKEHLQGDLWLQASVKDFKCEFGSSDDMYWATVETDSPFKMKDVVRGNGFAYLTKNGCMDEESSDDCFFDM
jgi:hypothetical protein